MYMYVGMYICVCMCVSMCMCVRTCTCVCMLCMCMEARRQLSLGNSSLEAWESNSCQQAWHQRSLPTEPFSWPLFHKNIKRIHITFPVLLVLMNLANSRVQVLLTLVFSIHFIPMPGLFSAVSISTILHLFFFHLHGQPEFMLLLCLSHLLY